jgi:hypothetical protein
MYVLDVNDFAHPAFNNQLPVHEQAMRLGLLKRVIERTDIRGAYHVYPVYPDGTHDQPIKDGTKTKEFSRADFVAISHQWLRPSKVAAEAHPDSADHKKCSALKQYFEMDRGRFSFFWMDYVSIPQADCPSLRSQQGMLSGYRNRFSGARVTLFGMQASLSDICCNLWLHHDRIGY